MPQPFVFFIDVDNTLLDNDQIKQEIKQSLIQTLGREEAEHFWQHHDEFRAYKQLVDFPSITREYCAETRSASCEYSVGSIFTGINFKTALFPEALAVVKHLKQLGEVAIFSEGDMVYQKMKIEKSGLAAAVNRTFLYEHKLEHLEESVAVFPAATLVFIDDHDINLEEIKKRLPLAVTIMVCQGHYTRPDCSLNHTTDKVVEKVAELVTWTAADFDLLT